MSHTIHTTVGIVIGAQYHGKANRRFTILTRDFGLISVQAQGIRELASKSRFHMQVFNHITFDCLRGKEGWRLVGVDAGPFVRSPEVFFHTMYARIFRLLRRLVIGEEDTQPALYDWIRDVYLFTQEQKNALQSNKNATHMLEILIIAKILDLLGYINNTSIKELRLDEKSIETIELFSDQKKELVAMINESLIASQL